MLNYICICTQVRPEWLVDMAPHYYDLQNWPPGDTKVELERTYRRIKQEEDYHNRQNIKHKRSKDRDPDDFGRDKKSHKKDKKDKRESTII